MVLLAAVLAMGCGSSELAPPIALKTGGEIPPETFQFVEIVPVDEYGGGWRAVCVLARMGQDIDSTGIEAEDTCDLDETCRKIQMEMMRLLNQSVGGSTVKKCHSGTKGPVPVVTWP